MESIDTRALRREERIALELRALYERYGFCKYRMGAFEEYELYAENKRFLKNPNVITFHDLEGRVMAMKPDVTLSIAKNTRAGGGSAEKVYYQENVYWLERQGGGYREVSQLGLESIGRLDTLGYYEVLCLAKKTLAAISAGHMMQLSHVGFWVSLLEGLDMGPGLQMEILERVKGKRLHELLALLEAENTPAAGRELLMRAAALCGDFGKTLEEARSIALSSGMAKALDQLEAVYGLLDKKGLGDRITLDFSLVDHSDYYDGVIFQGYVEGLPRAVLTGGSYGKLLEKFGRSLDAVGFAVYLDELDELFRNQRETEADALILYDGGADLSALEDQADALRAQGLRVRLERSRPDNIRPGNVFRFDGSGLKEAGEDA